MMVPIVLFYRTRLIIHHPQLLVPKAHCINGTGRVLGSKLNMGQYLGGSLDPLGMP